MGALEELQRHASQARSVGFFSEPSRGAEQSIGVVSAVTVLAPGTFECDVLDDSNVVGQSREESQAQMRRFLPPTPASVMA